MSHPNPADNRCHDDMPTETEVALAQLILGQRELSRQSFRRAMSRLGTAYRYEQAVQHALQMLSEL